MDQADLIDRERERQLEAKLRAHEQATQHQLAVLTIASLEGEPIEDYSMRVAESWKLGHAKEDNGLLLLVVAKEKKVRIEVGYGLEGEVPDVIAGRIIRNVIVPRFGQGNFAGGIEEAMQLLMNASAGKQVEIDGGGASFEPGFSNAWPLLVFLLLFLVLPAFGARRGRSGMLFWGGLGQSGFGGRSGGGGFSGGGGGFGGGGASGGW
jgi:uncharacterized protein